MLYICSDNVNIFIPALLFRHKGKENFETFSWFSYKLFLYLQKTTNRV